MISTLTQRWIRENWQVALVGVLVAGSGLMAESNRAIAQSITFDGTLGSSTPLSGPNYVIPQSAGQTAGQNVFHSFGRFNLNNGETVQFQSGAGVRNILSRVTGGSRSSINGRISTAPGVNLFLLNPGGISFGRNAQLNVGGAFVATTANSLQFGNLGNFNALPIAGESVSLLTINPSALQFNQAAAQSIAIRGSTLSVPNGRSLLLIGGEVSLDDSTLRALGSRIGLGGLAQAGTVGLTVNEAGSDIRPEFPRSNAWADVAIGNRSEVNVASGGGGDITIHANDFTMTRGGVLFGGIGRGLGAVGRQAGDISVFATGAVTLGEDALNTLPGLITNEIGISAIGSGGDIHIEAGSVSLLGTSQLRTRTLTDNAQCSSQPCNAGNISIRTGTLTVRGPQGITGNGPGLIGNTRGFGDAGDFQIDVDEAAFFGNRGRLESIVQTQGVGRGSAIAINTGSLTLSNVGRFLASSQGRGDTGSIAIRARGAVNLTEGSRLEVDLGDRDLSQSVGVGNGRDITIEAQSVSIAGSFLQAATNGDGPAGNIRIEATDFVNITGFQDRTQLIRSRVLASTEPNANGRGGNIEIQTGTLRMSEGSALNAQSTNRFAGGSITINANQIELLSGAQVVTTALGSGDAGDITLNVTGRLTLSGSNPNFPSILAAAQRRVAAGEIPSIYRVLATNSAASGIFAETTDQGAAGNLNINANQLRVENGAQISAATLESATGRGGDIQLESDRITLQTQGQITVSSAGTGIAGNLSILGNSILLNTQGRISAETISTSGGNITLRLLDSLRINNGQVSASTQTGQAGNLTINAANAIRLTGKGELSVEATSGGRAGNLEITTQRFTAQNGARVAVSSTRQGTAGDLQIAARNITLNQAQLTAETASGRGGNISLDGLNVLRSTNSSISASTENGQGGSITINANGGTVLLSGENGISAEAIARGTAGSLTITADQLTVRNNARASVRSADGQAGNLTIRASNIVLDQGTLTAATAASNSEGGANINLQNLNLLLLRNRSQISAQALNRGDGGNINIDAEAGSIVAIPSENSDIVADAGSGNGGNITITTQGIFGLIPSEESIPLSEINASSDFGIDGTININTLGVDPSQGLIELPTEVVDGSQLIAQDCPVRSRDTAQQRSEFVVTGRGGLPPSPSEPLSQDAVLTEWITPDTLGGSSSTEAGSAPAADALHDPSVAVVEAQGWLTTAAGDVALIAQAPAPVSYRSAFVAPSCNEP